MRRIGLIGGMSEESTQEYRRVLVDEVRSRLGGLHSPDYVSQSVDFAEVEPLMGNDWDAIARRLSGIALGLQSLGAEAILITSNSMHKLAPHVEAAIDVPLLSVIDVMAKEVRAAGLQHVGLLGTRFVMEDSFYRDGLAQRGVTTDVPDEAERETVNRVIFDELCQGRLTDDSRSAYRRIMENLVQRGAQGMLLACTEIELLVGQDDVPVPAFPSARLHATAAVDFALQQGA